MRALHVLPLLGLLACPAPESTDPGTDPRGAAQLPEIGVDDKGDVDVFPEDDPPPPTEAELFTCDGSPGSAPARIRRMQRREWTRTIGQPIGGLADTNPLDVPANLEYSTFAEGVSMDPATLDLYLTIAPLAGGNWKSRDPRGGGLIRQRTTYEDGSLKCMWSDASPDDACIDNWLGRFLQRGVLYRPPTDDEFDHLRAFLVDALASEASSGATREETLEKVTTAAWLTSGALFREELGGGLPDAHGRHRLRDEEVGLMLAYMLTDRAPGTTGTFRWQQGPDGSSWTAPFEGYLADIQAAVDDGTIQDPDVIRAIVRRHAAGVDPERYDLNMGSGGGDRDRRGEFWMGHKVERFFREYFDVDGFPGAFKDTPQKTSLFDDSDTWSQYNLVSSYNNLQSGYYGREAPLVPQFVDAVARVVAEDEDVFARLMTTRTFYVPSNAEYRGSSIHKATDETARPYGVTWDVDPTREARWVTLPEGERSGMLTHPAWLAAHGDNFEDGPSLILRGHWVREKLLCQDVPGLELVMVEAKLQDSDGTVSARHRVEQDIETRGECMACHDRMNSLGKPFEQFNHAGFLRAYDHGGPADGSTVVADAANGYPDVIDGTYADVGEFTEALAASPTAKRCFIRHTFRYFAGREETVADACALTAMEQAYDDSNGSFVSMLEALATSDVALYRHVPEEEGR